MNLLPSKTLLTLLAVALGTAGVSPATQPSAPSPATVPAPDVPPPEPVGSLEMRVMQAIGSGDYAAALPLLRRMADLHKDDPRKSKAIEEQIRMAERMLNSANAPGSLAPEERKPIPLPKAGETADFENIRDLGNFEYDAEHGGGIPADVKALNGARIRLKGFMIPMDQAERISTFALVPDLFACCFGQPPQIQHTVVVKTPKGKSIAYYPDQIVIEGTLTVEEKKEEGFIVSVFEVLATSVKPTGH